MNMNYQRLLKRFYPTSDPENVEIMQKYGPPADTFSSFGSEEAAAGSSSVPDVESDEERARDEDELLFVTAPATWEPPSPEQAAELVVPLLPEEVRWFYKPTDDKVWCEFNGYDSILIENTYRAQQVNENHILKPETTKTDAQPDKSPHPDSSSSDLDKPPQKTTKEPTAVKPLKFEETCCCHNTAKNKELKSIVQCPRHPHNDGRRSPPSPADLGPSHSDDEGRANKIVVRGGTYEVDLSKMTCESIYWPGEQSIITRGLYFYDGSWQPLEGCHGDVLETEHLRLFGQPPSDANGTPPPLPGVAMHSQHFPQFHVEWMSSHELYLYWGGAPRQLVRSVTQKLGFYQSTGYRLRRGYRTLASLSERPPDITHVVFVIHGIGQKMDAGRIIRNTNALRANCDWLRVQQPWAGARQGRAELFPARWRAGERGEAATLLAAAAPPGAPALRRAINDAAMDVMYYTSPLYGKQVQDDLRHELNRLYSMFMARNPQYRGHFSAVAHSLGCVILYDIIIDHQIGCERCAEISQQGCCPRPGLLFPLQQMFCLGSPLSVFLAMRHPTPSLERILPAAFTPRLYNIFHLSDPVAYRMEPLASRWHATQPPVGIPPYTAYASSPIAQASPAKGPWRIWSYVKHPWQRSDTGSPIPPCPSNQSLPVDVNDSEKLDPEILKSLPDDIVGSKTKEQLEALLNIKLDINAPKKNDIEDSTIGSNQEKSPPKSPPSESELKNPEEKEINPEDVLPYRIDYSVRDTGIGSNYLSAMTAHTSYWNNYDVGYFIMTHLSPEMAASDDAGLCTNVGHS